MFYCSLLSTCFDDSEEKVGEFLRSGYKALLDNPVICQKEIRPISVDLETHWQLPRAQLAGLVSPPRL